MGERKKIIELISKQDIKVRIGELGEKISKDFEGKEFIALVVLRGASIFAADLVREIKSEKVVIDNIQLSSYRGGKSSTGIVKVVHDMLTDPKGKDILVIEDIVDTGKSMNDLVEYLSSREPSSIRVCTLLDKPDNRQEHFKPDYIGFTITNLFVVGFGMDDNERLRNLPYIGYYHTEPELDIQIKTKIVKDKKTDKDVEQAIALFKKSLFGRFIGLFLRKK